MHVRCNSWYIFLPSSAKQQCEVTEFCTIVLRMMVANFLKFYFKVYAVFQIKACNSLTVRNSEKEF